MAVTRPQVDVRGYGWQEYFIAPKLSVRLITQLVRMIRPIAPHFAIFSLEGR